MAREIVRPENIRPEVKYLNDKFPSSLSIVFNLKDTCANWEEVSEIKGNYYGINEDYTILVKEGLVEWEE